jgi:haloalkane dehalogenase
MRAIIRTILAAVGTAALSGCMTLMPMMGPSVDAEPSISAEFPYESQFVEVLGSSMHYVEQGAGDPILLLHGNPTSSYLWRNVIPHISPVGRVIAPDLIGMGKSDKPDIAYQLQDHIRYMDAFIEALELENVVLVLHDWGGGVGFDYAMRHPENVRGIVFMEAVVKPMSWADTNFAEKYLFETMRDEQDGYDLNIVDNYFVEKLLPMMAGRAMSEAEMDVYREPYLKAADRKPVKVWPQEIPIDGTPERNDILISNTYEKLKESSVPLLLLVAEPGMIMKKEFVATLKHDLPRMETVDIGEGLHFIQETQPTKIGEAAATWISGLTRENAESERAEAPTSASRTTQ